MLEIRDCFLLHTGYVTPFGYLDLGSVSGFLHVLWCSMSVIRNACGKDSGSNFAFSQWCSDRGIIFV